MDHSEGQDSSTRISEASRQLKEAQLALREAEQAREAAKQQLQSAAQNPMPSASLLDTPSGTSSGTAEVDGRIATLNRNLDTLLQRYTEQHPDVVGTRRLIKDLEEQKRTELEQQRAAAASAAAAAGSSGAAGALGGAAQQEVGKMLATYDLQVASLRARVAEYTERYKQAVARLKSAPQIEAEAARLNRDYSIHKKNYDTLVTRRESATMSGELDVASGVVDFRLIDPPRVSPEPVAPDRQLLLALAFAITLGAGLLTAFAGSQLRPVFHGAVDLRSKVAVPLLGVVSMVTSAVETRRERMDLIRFAAGSGGLLGTFVLVFVAMVIIAARKVG